MDPRDSMETFPVGEPDIKINKVGGRDNVKRKKLKLELEKTNQAGPYQQLDGQFFETEFQSKTKMCNFPVSLVTYVGKVPKSNGNPEQDVPSSTYMALDPQFEWNRRWLSYTFEKPEKKEGVKIASEPDTYTNTEYYYCLAKPVARSKIYRNMYVETNKATFAGLTADDLKEEFHVLKCNWAVADQVDYNDHCKVMHGIVPGKMRAETNISVNHSLPFKLNSAMTILNLGTGDHSAILQGWYTKAVASGLVTKTSNKASADIQESRSRELLDDIIRVTEKSFNKKFEIELKKRPTVVGDLDYAFTCKWEDIEAAFFAALGNDQSVDRHDNFVKEQYTLGGNTMEFIISEVDTTVDRCFGKSETNLYRLGKKYEIIFVIANNIPHEFRVMSTHIRQNASEALADIEKAKSITEFMAQLSKDFETKNMTRDYTKGMIPAHKKNNIAANSADIKDKSIKVAGWEEKRIPFAKDNEFKAKLRAIVEPKMKESANNGKNIWEDEEVKKLHTEDNVQSCNSCGSINCRLLFKLSSSEAKSKKGGQRLGSCTGKPATFDNPGKFALAYTPFSQKGFGKKKKNKKEVTLPAATVTTNLIIPPMPKIKGHDLSKFLANANFTPRKPSAMEDFDMESLSFNTATITVNDTIKNSNSSDNTDNEGSENENINSDSDGMESEEYQGAQYLSTDTAERRMREARMGIFPSAQQSSESSNEEESEEYQGAQYLSTDTAERRMREARMANSTENLPSVQQSSESSDGSADSRSSKKSRKRQSRKQRDQNQAYKKLFSEMQEKLNTQSELMHQNNKSILELQDSIKTLSENKDVLELQDNFKIISEKMSENNETMEKNTAGTSKSHQTILKSYSHFSELTENFTKFQTNEIHNVESQIKELAEMIESGQADNITLSHQVNDLKALIITMTTAMANKIDTIQVVNPPPSGHDINDKDNNRLMVTNLTSVVKRESNEAINSSEDHIIFSGDESTAVMESTLGNEEQENTKDIINLETINILPSTVKQEEFLTCEEQVLNMDSEDDKEDNIMEDISLSSNRRPKKHLKLKCSAPVGELQRRKARKARKKLRKIQQEEDERDYYTDWFINLITAICFAVFQTGKLLFKNENQKVIWTLFFLLASGSMFPNVVSAANPNSAIRLPGEDTQISLLNALHSDTGNQTFTTYTTQQLDVVTYETQLKGVILNGNELMTRSCGMLGQWDDLCSEDNSTCAIAGISKKSLEDAMTLVTQGFYTLGAVCEIEDFPTTKEIISRCYQGLPWTAGEGIAQQYPFLLQMFESFGQHIQRPKRFAITSSIAIAVAIGLFSGTAAIGTSLAIAKEEGLRISNEQDKLRALDAQNAVANNLKNNEVSTRLGKAWDTFNYMSTLSAQTMGTYHDAEEWKHETIFLFNEEEVLTFHDPATEIWQRAISNKTDKYSFAFTKSERKEASRMTSGLTSVTTSLLSMKPQSNKCRDTMLLKTLTIPIVDYNQSRVFRSDNGLLKDYSDKDTYTLLSEDAIISKKITLFKRNIQVIGRTCSVDNSVNSSSTYSGNYLVENYKFTFSGELTFTETSFINGSVTTQDWTFRNEANISLPLTCSIKSKLINCGSIKIKSDKTKTITLKDNQMKIWKREHIEERRATLTKDYFLTQPITAKDLTIHNVWSHPLGGISVYQWIIIAIASMAILALGFWYYCRKPKYSQAPIQEEKSNKFEMKAYFGSQTPTYMHPEAQHTSPEAPPRPTSDKGTSPNVKGKSKWEKRADEQMRNNPFHRITSCKDFEEAKAMRKRLDAKLGISNQ